MIFLCRCLKSKQLNMQYQSNDIIGYFVSNMKVGTYADALSMSGAIRIPERTERSYAQRVRAELAGILNSGYERLSRLHHLVSYVSSLPQEEIERHMMAARYSANRGNIVEYKGHLEYLSDRGVIIDPHIQRRLDIVATHKYLVNRMQEYGGPDLEGLMLFKEICQDLASKLDTTLEAIWEKESRRRQKLSSREKNEVAA